MITEEWGEAHCVLAFASLPSIIGVEQEVVCLWKFPFDCCCFANCHFCFELGMEEFFVLLGGLELPNVKRPSLPPGSSRGDLRPETVQRQGQRNLRTETEERWWSGTLDEMKLSVQSTDVFLFGMHWAVFEDSLFSETPINSERSLKTVALCQCCFWKSSSQLGITAELSRGHWQLRTEGKALIQCFAVVFILHPITRLMHTKPFLLS